MLSTRTLLLLYADPASKRRIQVWTKPSSNSTSGSKVIRYVLPSDVVEVEGETVRGYYQLAQNNVSA